ncbi:MAG: pantetheine-phosphate adenylyltransferase [Candidatus Omnitrophota bacterium]|nr:pantetheine-phosphate adenylyltransferase [Candidatus Omnitrophota bacterium]
MKKAIYAGTFDPVTFGHIDLIKRALEMFDHLVVAVASSSRKGTLFSKKERIRMLKKATRNLKKVTVDGFDGLMIDYAREKKINIILRGLRAFSDFEYEFQMVLTNRKLLPKIETVFMMPREDYSYFSSKLIKEIAELNGNVTAFVPDFVARELKKRIYNGKTINSKK